jgi:hypothetical protein
MNRVLSALSENRCVLALSSKACNDLIPTEEFTERGAHPWMIFGAESQNGLPATTPEGLAPCTEKPGGLLVLIDPDFSKDSEGFRSPKQTEAAGSCTPVQSLSASHGPANTQARPVEAQVQRLSQKLATH